MSIYLFNNFNNFDIFKKLEGKCATQCGDDNGTISQLGRRILNVQATTTQKFHFENFFRLFIYLYLFIYLFVKNFYCSD